MISEYHSVFSRNAGKYGPEKLRIRTLFTLGLAKKEKRLNPANAGGLGKIRKHSDALHQNISLGVLQSFGSNHFQ